MSKSKVTNIRNLSEISDRESLSNKQFENKIFTNHIRINQFLSQNIGISRRKADELIQNKFVKVNSKHADIGQKVETSDIIEVFDSGKQNWSKVFFDTKKDKIIILYKPKNCITTIKDEFNRKTVYDFLPKKYNNLKPAGRLDYNSEGLLIFSNNGYLIQKLTHPSFNNSKKYLVALRNKLSKEFINKLKSGYILEGKKINPVYIKYINEINNFENVFVKYNYLKLEKNYLWYEFTLSEGKNNQIRKLCLFENQKVYRLIRIQQGKYQISKQLYQKGFLEI